MMSKRIFDIIVTLSSFCLWGPVIIFFALVNLFFEGFPIFYSSMRRVSMDEIKSVYKFRTMVRNAEKIYNRETVSIENVRFLNTPITSPLYTKIGRIIEKNTLTELPQFIHVLQGYMSIVGNRPLPENVVNSLNEEFPGSILRFKTPAGMTGPIQLIGRSEVIDRDRLILEITYCEAVKDSYTWKLDFLILLYTVLIALKIMNPMTVEETKKFISKHTNYVYKFPESLCRRKQASERENIIWSDEEREWTLNSKNNES